jgi:hypothetical protein
VVLMDITSRLAHSIRTPLLYRVRDARTLYGAEHRPAIQWRRSAAVVGPTAYFAALPAFEPSPGINSRPSCLCQTRLSY